MAKNLTPQEIAEKWARRTKNAQPDYIKGVESVTKNPAEAAIAKQDKMVANWQESVTSGKWKRGMGRVTLESWKASAAGKGSQRLSAGIDAAGAKSLDFYAQLLPFQADLSAKVGKMPDLSIEDSVQRSAAWIRGMAQFKRSK